MEGEDAARFIEPPEVELERLPGEKVDRNRVAAECVHGQDVKAMRGAPLRFPLRRSARRPEPLFFRAAVSARYVKRPWGPSAIPTTAGLIS